MEVERAVHDAFRVESVAFMEQVRVRACTNIGFISEGLVHRFTRTAARIPEPSADGIALSIWVDRRNEPPTVLLCSDRGELTYIGSDSTNWLQHTGNCSPPTTLGSVKALPCNFAWLSQSRPYQVASPRPPRLTDEYLKLLRLLFDVMPGYNINTIENCFTNRIICKLDVPNFRGETSCVLAKFQTIYAQYNPRAVRLAELCARERMVQKRLDDLIIKNVQYEAQQVELTKINERVMRADHVALLRLRAAKRLESEAMSRHDTQALLNAAQIANIRLRERCESVASRLCELDDVPVELIEELVMLGKNDATKFFYHGTTWTTRPLIQALRETFDGVTDQLRAAQHTLAPNIRKPVSSLEWFDATCYCPDRSYNFNF